MALVYATGGKELLMEEVVVDMAKSVVTVSATRAGAYKNKKWEMCKNTYLFCFFYTMHRIINALIAKSRMMMLLLDMKVIKSSFDVSLDANK